MVEKEVKVSTAKKRSGASMLDRAKLHNYGGGDDTDASTLRSIVVLIVVIILVAVGGAYFIKSLQNRNTQDNVTPPPTTGSGAVVDDEMALEDSYLSYIVLADAQAENAPEVESFTSEDTEIEGNTDATFTLSNLAGQPYESFYRVEFTFTPNSALADDAQEFPSVMVVHENEGTVLEEYNVSFNGVSQDSTGLVEGGTLQVENSVLTAISKNSDTPETGLSYGLMLAETTTYFVQVVDNRVIIDIWETENADLEEPTPSVSPSVSPGVSPTPQVSPTPGVSASPTPRATTGASGTTQIAATTSNNDAALSGYTYDDTPAKFIYRLKLANEKVPGVTSTAQEASVTVKIDQLAYDGLTRDGQGFTNFAEKGVVDIETLTISRTGNVSTYTFDLTKRLSYNIFHDKERNEIVIEFMH